MTAQAWAVLAGAFLLGSFPTAYLVGRALAGVDVREMGDGNVGAKNTFGCISPPAGVFVALVDVGKGAGIILAARALDQPDAVIRAAGLGVVLGHDFNPFLHFRGGQGMAAIAGILCMLYPREFVAALAISLVVLALSRCWNLFCGVGLGFFAALLWFTGHTAAEALYPAVLLPTIGLSKLWQTWQARRAVHRTAH